MLSRVWLLLVFAQGFVHFGFIVVVVVVITFFRLFSRFCAFMFIRKKVKKKKFPFVVVATAAGDGKDPKGNIVKATAY
jgi:hypothetical protein